LGALVVSVGVAYQGGVIEKLIQSFAAVARIHGGVYEFAQVLDSRIRFRRVFLFELLDVARAIDEELEDFGGVGWCGAGTRARFGLVSNLRRRNSGSEVE